MLSIVGFVLEATPIGKARIDKGIAFTGYFGEGKEIHSEGDIIVQAPKKEMAEEERARHRPNSRSVTNEESILLKHRDLPANNTSKQNEPKLWQWDGFDRDEPRPSTRTSTERESSARQRMGLAPLRGSKPRRKNI
jgi:hypothetical protein